jgi:hypothetical protein
MGLETELSSALEHVELERQSYARPVVARFEERYQQPFRQLQELWREGDELAKSLRVPVDMPLPVRVVNPARADYLAKGTTRLERIVLPESTSPAATDVTSARIGQVLDALSSALAYSRGLVAAKARPVHNVSSNLPYSPDGLFKVLREFRDGIDGEVYKPGVLVDSSLIDARQLARLTAIRQIVLTGASGQSSEMAVA